MVSKRNWKKYGVDVSKYSPEQLKKYNKSADYVIKYCYNSDEIYKTMRTMQPRKTIKGVKYYGYYDFPLVPAPIHKATIRIIADKRKAERAAIRRAHAAAKKRNTHTSRKRLTSSKKKSSSGRVSVRAYRRKPTVRAYTRRRPVRKKRR